MTAGHIVSGLSWIGIASQAFILVNHMPTVLFLHNVKRACLGLIAVGHGLRLGGLKRIRIAHDHD